MIGKWQKFRIAIFAIEYELHHFINARSTGAIKSIIDSDSGITVNIEQSYGFYKAFSPEGNQDVTDPPPFDTKFNVKGAGMCLPGYVDSEGDELPWLLGSAETWQNGGKETHVIDFHFTWLDEIDGPDLLRI